MDLDLAIQCLSEYGRLVERADKLPMFTRDRRAARTEINRRLPLVNSVLRGLAPDLQLIRATDIPGHVAGQPIVRRALILLRGWQEMTSGAWTGPAPLLPMTLLDPIVSQVAVPLWKAEKFRQAVSDAATNLNSFAQLRIGRHDISDKDLMAQAFSDSAPERGKSRLRCPGSHTSQSVRSQQEGARAFAIGTFQAIRNPAAHLPGDWNPVTAFHHLTALSQVAHYFRNWDVRVWVPEPDLSTMNAAADALMKLQQPRTGIIRASPEKKPAPPQLGH